MNWLIMLVAAIISPVVQPVLQQGVQNIQARVQQVQPVAQPQYVFHQGRWWKYESGQWYYEVLPQERMAWQPPVNLNVQ